MAYPSRNSVVSLDLMLPSAAIYRSASPAALRPHTFELGTELEPSRKGKRPLSDEVLLVLDLTTARWIILGSRQLQANRPAA